MNKALNKTNLFLRRVLGRLEALVIGKPFTCCLFMGIFMNILIYFLNACSFTGGIKSIFEGFGFFIFNSIILIAFYCISLFFARRIFVMTFVTLFWLAMGITNCVLMVVRDAPLEGIDFYILRTGISIILLYLSVFEIIFISLLILLAIALLVLLFIKCPKFRPRYIKALLIIICCLLILFLLAFTVISTRDFQPQDYTADNIGFPYFFLRSIFDRGIDRPVGYSEEKIQESIKELAQMTSGIPASRPDIIFVQLESYFDLSRMSAVQFSQDPTPTLTSLAESFPSGLMSVYSVGSGTANTEFEVLSGLDLGFFGVGEYPYQSILGNKTAETIAYDLKELGYGTHALHNHTATFYDRYTVYSNLGFDSFTAVEYMKDVQYNDIGWEKDEILTDYIIKALDSTEGSDFVFAVSVQCHGKYSDIEMDNGPIEVFGIDDQARLNSFEFYANELYATDAFVRELYETLCQRNEEFVLVLYGDHFPALEIQNSELSKGDIFKTDYIIASNIDLSLSDADINAHSLFPTVLEALGINTGLVNRVHANYKNDPAFKDILQLVGYDMLYGDRLAYEGSYPQTPTDIKLGIDDISITDVSQKQEGVWIYGENFTPFSAVFINGSKQKTEFISDTALLISKKEIEYGDVFEVSQISSDLRRLSTTSKYTYTRDFLD